MKWYEEANITHVVLDDNEDEQKVLRELLKSCFALARPTLLGEQYFKEDQRLTNYEAEQFIYAPPSRVLKNYSRFHRLSC